MPICRRYHSPANNPRDFDEHVNAKIKASESRHAKVGIARSRLVSAATQQDVSAMFYTSIKMIAEQMADGIKMCKCHPILPRRGLAPRFCRLILWARRGRIGKGMRGLSYHTVVSHGRGAVRVEKTLQGTAFTEVSALQAAPSSGLCIRNIMPINTPPARTYTPISQFKYLNVNSSVVYSTTHS